MKKDNVFFSSKSVEWETPKELFADLDATFHFTLDVCSRNEMAKCKRYFCPTELDVITAGGFSDTQGDWPKVDGLAHSWGGEICFMNPPYGRGISQWVEKAYQETAEGKMPTVVVGLLPANTDTRWFHNCIYEARTCRISFLRGRLKFGGATNSAPFASMLVEWRNFGNFLL